MPYRVFPSYTECDSAAEVLALRRADCPDSLPVTFSIEFSDGPAPREAGGGEPPAPEKRRPGRPRKEVRASNFKHPDVPGFCAALKDATRALVAALAAPSAGGSLTTPELVARGLEARQLPPALGAANRAGQKYGLGNVLSSEPLEGKGQGSRYTLASRWVEPVRAALALEDAADLAHDLAEANGELVVVGE